MDSVGWHVRRAVAENWRASRAIRLLALTEAPLAFASTLEREIAFDDDVWQQRIAASAQFLAETDDGAVVGTATGFTDLEAPDTVLLVAMYVTRPARGQGIGEGLVRAVVDQARIDGADRVLLHVVETNPGAERLYVRCGFARTGATLRLPHSPDLLEHEMVLSLADPLASDREWSAGSVWSDE